MKKLIHVKKHLREGKVVKSHSRKSTKAKNRSLAEKVGGMRKGRPNIAGGRRILQDSQGTDSLAAKPSGTVLSQQAERRRRGITADFLKSDSYREGRKGSKKGRKSRD